MKFWKHSLATAFLFIGISTAVTYTACTQDSCSTLKCRNNGTCADGFCRCPEGYEGTQCEIASIDRFLGVYDGYTKIDGEPVYIDSAIINGIEYPDRIKINIFSNPDWAFKGRVVGETVIMDPVEGKIIDLNYIGNEKIELLIDETVNGNRRVVNFSGVKR